MELLVQEITKLPPIEFNYDELRNELTQRVADYKTLVYTDADIKSAKADRASLNRLKKALNDERIRLEKEYMQPFADFKTKVAELCGIVDEAATAIDVQVKEYEEAQKEKKRAEITELFQTSFQGYPWLTLSQIWDDKWLNATVSMKKIQEAFTGWEEKIRTDLEMLQRLPEYSFEATETYKKTLKLEDAMWQADHLKLMAEAKKAAQQPEPAQNGENIQQTMDLPFEDKKPDMDAPEPRREWVSFRVYISREEAVMLNHFVKASNIRIERI